VGERANVVRNRGQHFGWITPKIRDERGKKEKALSKKQGEIRELGGNNSGKSRTIRRKPKILKRRERRAVLEKVCYLYDSACIVLPSQLGKERKCRKTLLGGERRSPEMGDEASAEDEERGDSTRDRERGSRSRERRSLKVIVLAEIQVPSSSL